MDLCALELGRGAITKRHYSDAAIQRRLAPSYFGHAPRQRIRGPEKTKAGSAKKKTLAVDSPPRRSTMERRPVTATRCRLHIPPFTEIAQ